MSQPAERFQSHNPATQEVVWEGYATTPQNVDKAVEAARKTEWASRTVQERIGYLESFRTNLNKASEKVAEAISQETGKPLWESRTEVQAMINKIALSIEAYQMRCSDILHAHSIARHKPHGVVAVFGPFNFPGHLPNGHIVPALLAGNTVIFKPSELTPRVAELTVQCWADLPPGVLQLVQGGRATGAALASHPDLTGLFFTGSLATGQIFAKQFPPEKILALELGGNNPLVVSGVNDLEAAALITLQSAFLTSGQRCTCARRLILLENPEAEKFLECLKQWMGRIRVGAYTEQPEPFMGPLITLQAAQKMVEAQRNLKSSGGKVLIEMQQKGAFLTPGLIDVTEVRERPDVEYFGPFLQLIRVKDMPAAFQEANRTRYGLCAGLLSDSEEEYRLFYKSVKAGVINWNSPLTGASSALPFGGIKQSGNHRPSAFYAADYCSYPVASMETGKLEKIMPPGLAE